MQEVHIAQPELRLLHRQAQPVEHTLHQQVL